MTGGISKRVVVIVCRAVRAKGGLLGQVGLPAVGREVTTE